VILSMTGYGKASYDEDGVKADVEVQSVNGRFFDLKSKMPRYLNEFEGELREITHRFIERGRVNLSITIDLVSACLETLNIDYSLAERYVQFSDEIANRCGIENNVDARSILRLPDVIQSVEAEESSDDTAALWEVAKKAIIPALEAHKAMRAKEGAVIGSDIGARLESVRNHMVAIERRSPVVLEENTHRLRKRIEQLIENDRIDESRFTLEVAIYAERTDITEECVRYYSHCDVFAQELSGKKASGKKLSFLLQEMNREANTTASKASDAEISQLVVQIKEEQEKMREQVENIE